MGSSSSSVRSRFFCIRNCSCTDADDDILNKSSRKWLSKFLLDCAHADKNYFWSAEILKSLQPQKMRFNDDYYSKQIHNCLENAEIMRSGIHLPMESKKIKPNSLKSDILGADSYTEEEKQIKRILKDTCFLPTGKIDETSINEAFSAVSCTPISPYSSFNSHKSSKRFNSNTFVFESNKGEEGKLSLKNVKEYKSFTNEIEKQLKISESPLGFLSREFCRIYIKDIESEMMNEIKNYFEILDYAMWNLKGWFDLLINTINEFFGLKEFNNPLLNRDNMISFITSFYLQIDEIYEIFFNLQKNLDFEAEGKISKSIEKTNLNNSNDGKYSEAKKSSISPVHPDLLVFLHLEKGNQKSQIHKGLSYLRILQNLKSPIHKLKILMKIARCISKTVEEFKKNHFKKETIVDSDEILGIFVFLCIHSKAVFLVSHMNLIEKFVPDNLLNSISGYYLSTIQAALKYIEEYELN